MCLWVKFVFFFLFFWVCPVVLVIDEKASIVEHTHWTGLVFDELEKNYIKFGKVTGLFFDIPDPFAPGNDIIM